MKGLVSVNLRAQGPEILILLFVSLGVSVPEMMSGLHLLILVAAGFTLHWQRRRLTGNEKALLAVFLVYWGIGLLTHLVGGMTELGSSVIGRDVRILLAIPVIFLLARVRLPSRHLYVAVGVAGILAAVFAVGEYIAHGMSNYRVSGPTISIVFGNCCASLAAFNLGIATMQRGRRQVFHLLAAAGAILAVFLSGTRGAVLAILVAAIVILLSSFFSARPRKRVIAAFAALVAIVILAVPNFGGIRQDALYKDLRKLQASASAIEGDPEIEGYAWSDSSLDAFLADSLGPLRRVEGRGADAPPVFFEVGSKSRRVRVRFPYRNAGNNAELTLLVKGDGELSDGSGTSLLINATNWQEMAFTPDAEGRYPRLRLTVRRGDSLQFLPRIDHPAEWCFTRFASSVGTRLVMWEYVLSHDSLPTLLGAGLGSFPDIAEIAWRRGELPYFTTSYDHVHNDFLNVLFERGIIGLISLLGLYVIPLLACFKSISAGRNVPLAMGGVGFVISMAVSGFTETMLIHSYSISFFGVMLAILVSMLSEPKNHLPEKT